MPWVTINNVNGPKTLDWWCTYTHISHSSAVCVCGRSFAYLSAAGDLTFTRDLLEMIIIIFKIESNLLHVCWTRFVCAKAASLWVSQGVSSSLFSFFFAWPWGHTWLMTVLSVPVGAFRAAPACAHSSHSPQDWAERSNQLHTFFFYLIFFFLNVSTHLLILGLFTYCVCGNLPYWVKNYTLRLDIGTGFYYLRHSPSIVAVSRWRC